MSRNLKPIALLCAAALLPFGVQGSEKKVHRAQETKVESTGTLVLWRNPIDIRSRDLFYGPGGRNSVPQGAFNFTKEDLDGSNPKFDVRDRDGVKWKVKLGEEAQPETAASRLVWAVGYFATEDYLVKDLRVQGMPARLHRGQKLVAPDGSIHIARLKKEAPGERKIGAWRWHRDPFSGTSELNGLRIMMALINNWDLKDDNNAVYADPKADLRIFLVSDLGSSFGTAGAGWPHRRTKGNLDSYRHSKFIDKVTANYVDFHDPSWPSMLYFPNLPEFLERCRLRWIGRHIPRADVKRMSGLLEQLSPTQIRDAFRAAGYTSDQVEGFAAVVESRIAQLSDL